MIRMIKLMISMCMLLSFLITGTDVKPPSPTETGESQFGFFPTGLYTVPYENIPEIQPAGFNMVQVYHDTQTLDEAIAYLEAAQANGLWVMQNMPRDFIDAGDEFWIEWVTRLSQYDALKWWYLPEEPTLRGVDHATLRRLYDIIHQYDPQNRPVAMYFGIIGPLDQWCDIADLIIVGCYPEYSQAPRACMKTWIDAAHLGCPSTPLVGAASLFDSRTFGLPGSYPSPFQARFDAYTALIDGAQGLFWFSYADGVQIPELWKGIHSLVAELNSLAPVLQQGSAGLEIQARVLDGPEQSLPVNGITYNSIQFMHKGNHSQAHLFASNLSEKPVRAEFSGLPAGLTSVTVLFEDRTLPVSQGAFSDDFAGNDVHVYRLWDETPTAAAPQAAPPSTTAPGETGPDQPG
jgi:hypothetical protein